MSIRFTLILIFGFCCQSQASDYRVISIDRFDSNIFTQGYVFENDHFYISSGGFGRSFVAIHDAKGVEIKNWVMPSDYFAEGITKHNNALYLITWKARTAFLLNAQTLIPEKSFSYSGEGWGITHDTKQLIMSNGSAQLQFKGFNDFKTTHTVNVSYNGQPVTQINELEYAHNTIWANVWKSDWIYQIDPSTGIAINRWDLSKLRDVAKRSSHESVLNGIAFSGEESTFWITGKNWSKRFLVQFKVEAQP